MAQYYVRSLEPLCPSKKIFASSEEVIEHLREVQKRTQKFRDKLSIALLNINKFNPNVLWKEVNKHTIIVKVNDSKYEKKFKIFRESELTDPYYQEEVLIEEKESA